MSNSATSTYETERKYEIADAAALPDPAGLAGLDSGAGAREQQLAAVYFDTEDLGLLRAGVTLRRREGGHDEGWHLKLPAGSDTREEVRLPLGRAGRTPPTELVGLTRLYSRGAALAPVAELTTHRRRWVYADGRGRELAELVEDEVDAHTIGSETRAMSWREVEVELAEHGRVELLDRIERELLRGGAHRSRSGSKLGRVLADRLTATPVGGSARRRVKVGSAAAELLAYLGAQAEQLRAQDPLVRGGAPDAVHQMRVAARRMRSALQAYRRVLDRSVTDGLVDELKWLGAQLSDARDSEVIEERLVDVVGSLPDELVLGPVSAQVTRSLQRRGAAGWEQASAALDSDRYLALHDAIDRLLADPPLTGRARRAARRELPRGVARAWRRTVKRMRAAQRAEPGADRDTALHETRKAAKRLRYAVEVAAPIVGKPARRLKRRLKNLHTVLGDHQDAVVARPVIRELATTAQYEGGNGFTYGVLHGLEHGRADRAERRVRPAWKRLRKSKNVKWLRG
ncbi:MAG TPA: CYTH and CHAD domain-containing protein [Pseudonocardia sp.]|jgi:CHAD domain-containing protein|nr:CYTH and CHAD domain-containing protein [Pseudonocardia sp.]